MASIAVAALGIAAAAAIILLPLAGVAQPTNAVSEPRLPVLPATTEAAGQTIDLTGLLDLDLHRPLIDARPTAAPAIAAGDMPIGLRLTGTIMEPMHACAIFTNAAGSNEIKSVGERAGGAEVIAIHPDSVSLQFNGKVMVLHTVKTSAIGAPGL